MFNHGRQTVKPLVIAEGNNEKDSEPIGILNEAFAAGPPWPSLGYAIEGEWAGGAPGAVCGLALSGVNRAL